MAQNEFHQFSSNFIKFHQISSKFHRRIFSNVSNKKRVSSKFSSNFIKSFIMDFWTDFFEKIKKCAGREKLSHVGWEICRASDRRASGNGNGRGAAGAAREAGWMAGGWRRARYVAF